MKNRLLSLVLLLALTLTITGCVWEIGNYQNLELSDTKGEVDKVEFFDPRELEYDQAIRIYESERFEYSVYNIDDVLDAERTFEGEEAVAIYERIANMTFSNNDELILILAAIDPLTIETINGYFVRITYKSGEYDVIASHVQFYSAKSGDDPITTLECTVDWDVFIKEYID